VTATGTWALPARALEGSLTQLKQWRSATSEALAGFRRWALVNRLL
jgi:hypothetical protein